MTKVQPTREPFEMFTTVTIRTLSFSPTLEKHDSDSLETESGSTVLAKRTASGYWSLFTLKPGGYFYPDAFPGVDFELPDSATLTADQGHTCSAVTTRALLLSPAPCSTSEHDAHISSGMAVKVQQGQGSFWTLYADIDGVSDYVLDEALPGVDFELTELEEPAATETDWRGEDHWRSTLWPLPSWATEVESIEDELIMGSRYIAETTCRTSLKHIETVPLGVVAQTTVELFDDGETTRSFAPERPWIALTTAMPCDIRLQANEARALAQALLDAADYIDDSDSQVAA